MLRVVRLLGLSALAGLELRELCERRMHGSNVPATPSEEDSLLGRLTAGPSRKFPVVLYGLAVSIGSPVP